MKVVWPLILAKLVANTLQASGIKAGYDIDFAAFYLSLRCEGGASKSGHSVFYAVAAKCAKLLFIPPFRSGLPNGNSIYLCESERFA